ncbi:MAG TPA: hypothetical protein VMZ90_04345 [Vicinamibacterales bacterium]|nr:hypothetical protein [Vicinamibacterales bacterium]
MSRRLGLYWPALIASVLLIGACATRSSIQDGRALLPNQGLVALKMSSNSRGRLNYVTYTPTSSFGARLTENLFGPEGAISIRRGETYWVLPFDAGEYMWSKFEAGNLFSNIQSSNRFTVKPNTITYIGHIQLKLGQGRLEITAEDREEDFRAHLEAHYPAYLAVKPIEKSLLEFPRSSPRFALPPPREVKATFAKDLPQPALDLPELQRTPERSGSYRCLVQAAYKRKLDVGQFARWMSTNDNPEIDRMEKACLDYDDAAIEAVFQQFAVASMPGNEGITPSPASEPK